jgi:hypothetical protein
MDVQCTFLFHCCTVDIVYTTVHLQRSADTSATVGADPTLPIHHCNTYKISALSSAHFSYFPDVFVWGALQVVLNSLGSVGIDEIQGSFARLW